MTRTIVAATPLVGHTEPLLQIAGLLVAAGHDVTFVGGGRFGDRARALGAAARPLTGAAGYDDRRLDEAFPTRAAAAPGPEQLNHDITRIFGDAVPAQHAAVQSVLAEDPEQVLITDMLFLGAWPSALGAGIRPRRWVSVNTAPLYVPSEDSTPFGPVAVPPGGDAAAANRQANAAVEASFAPAMAHLLDVVTAVGGRRVGTAYLETVYALPDATVQLTVPEFEFPRRDLPDRIRFAGILPSPPPSSWQPPAWWGDLDGHEPVVVVTQGTLTNADLTALVAPSLAALADEDMLVVAALGNSTGELTAPVPANARVEAYVPFDRLLPRADVLVTNGGYGGVQRALAAGVPVVVAGTTEDKPAVAARVRATGVGVDLGTQHPDAAAVRRAVRTVLADPSYRQRAAELAAAYARLHAPTVIEELVSAPALTPH